MIDPSDVIEGDFVAIAIQHLGAAFAEAEGPMPRRAHLPHEDEVQDAENQEDRQDAGQNLPR